MRLLNKSKATKFYCFSPPVMLATMAIEAGLLIYVLITARPSKVKTMICLMLLFLGLFQMAEYFVCDGLKLSAAVWSRVGFIAITTLPPLGLHLSYEIAKKKPNAFLWLAYIAGTAWIVLFGFSEWAFANHICAGNYVIFHLRPELGSAYAWYYYGLLYSAILSCWIFARNSKKHIKSALGWLIIGYLVFLIPTAITNTIKPATVAGIPSIMCGFAVLFAIIMVARILPLATKKD